MSGVKLTNFVDIDIKRHLTTNAGSSREVVVLLNIGATTVPGELDARTTTYNNQAEVDALATAPDWKDYAVTYFMNGGHKLAVINTSANANQYVKDLEDIKPEWIVIAAYIASGVSDLTVEDIATAYNGAASHVGIYKKFFINTITTEPAENAVGIEGYATKYATGAPDACMSIAAYLSGIDVYRPDSIKDYAFTVERFASNTGRVFDDDEKIKHAIARNFNIDAKIAGSIVNIGGNDSVGNDLVNDYVLTVLHQTLTERLTQLLFSHIKYDQIGVGKMLVTLASELQRYVQSGYLTTDKIWTDADLIYNGETIITHNEPLNTGYKIVIMPVTKVADVHTPEIYILIADSYGIRKISIRGEVF